MPIKKQMAAQAAPKTPLTTTQMRSADYWRAICPHLHVGDAAAQAKLLAAAEPCCCSDADAATARTRLIDARRRRSDVRWGGLADPSLGEAQSCHR